MAYTVAYRDGTVVCQSSIPYLGYSHSTLKSLEQAGYILLVDGKRTKFPTTAQMKEAARTWMKEEIKPEA